MSAYLTVAITLKDLEKFREYGTKARPLILSHGGEPVVVGRIAKMLSGQAAHQMEVVLRFPDVAAIEAWYNSPEYQALVPLRDEGADTVFKVIEEL